VEWTFHVLPPLHSNFHLVDRRYELPVIAQIPKAMATGMLWFVPALVSAPVNLARYAAGPLIEKAQTLEQSYRIRRGYVFNYGSPRSIREAPISYRRPHAFVVGDEWTFITLAQNALLKALEKFFKAHKIDMKQFTSQAKSINRINKYNVGKIKAQNVAVGNKSHAGGDKK
jgi:hypothetical protein